MPYGTRMMFRRSTAAAMTAMATAVVAFIVAIALPISQLRLVMVVTECCCPDPAHCECPDHKPSDSGPTVLPCHKTVDTHASAPAPSAAPVAMITELAPPRALVALHHTHSSPH